MKKKDAALVSVSTIWTFVLIPSNHGWSSVRRASFFLESHIKAIFRGLEAIPEFFRAKNNTFCLRLLSFWWRTGRSLQTGFANPRVRANGRVILEGLLALTLGSSFSLIFVLLGCFLGLDDLGWVLSILFLPLLCSPPLLLGGGSNRFLQAFASVFFLICFPTLGSSSWPQLSMARLALLMSSCVEKWLSILTPFPSCLLRVRGGGVCIPSMLRLLGIRLWRTCLSAVLVVLFVHVLCRVRSPPLPFPAYMLANSIPALSLSPPHSHLSCLVVVWCLFLVSCAVCCFFRWLMISCLLRLIFWKKPLVRCLFCCLSPCCACWYVLLVLPSLSVSLSHLLFSFSLLPQQWEFITETQRCPQNWT